MNAPTRPQVICAATFLLSRNRRCWQRPHMIQKSMYNETSHSQIDYD